MLNACVRVDFLKNNPQHLDHLVNMWHQGIVNKWMPDVCASRVRDKLHQHINDNALPLTLIALINDVPVGMCSLRDNDGFDLI